MPSTQTYAKGERKKPRSRVNSNLHTGYTLNFHVFHYILFKPQRSTVLKVLKFNSSFLSFCHANQYVETIPFAGGQVAPPQNEMEVEETSEKTHADSALAKIAIEVHVIYFLLPRSVMEIMIDIGNAWKRWFSPKGERHEIVEPSRPMLRVQMWNTRRGECTSTTSHLVKGLGFRVLWMVYQTFRLAYVQYL